METITESHRKLWNDARLGKKISPADQKLIFTYPGKGQRWCLVSWIAGRQTLTEEAQLLIFEQPLEEAVKLLLTYICSRKLCRKAEQELYKLPLKEVKDILFKFIERGDFLEDSEAGIFKLPPDIRKKILPDVIAANGFDEEIEKYFFKLPFEEIKAILARMAKPQKRAHNKGLKDDVKFFKFSQAKTTKLLLLYISIFELSRDAQKKMFDMASRYRKVLLPFYMAKWNIASVWCMGLSKKEQIEIIRKRIADYPIGDNALKILRDLPGENNGLS